MPVVHSHHQKVSTEQTQCLAHNKHTEVTHGLKASAPTGTPPPPPHLLPRCFPCGISFSLGLQLLVPLP